MMAVVIAFVIIIAMVLGWTAIRIHRAGIGDLRAFVAQLVKRIMAFSGFAFIAFVCLISCYAEASEFLKSVLSENMVSNIKYCLRLLSGSESAFVALETIALSFVMISFISCVAYAFDMLIVLIAGRISCSGTAKEQDVSGGDYYSQPIICKTFLVYSRYNS